MCQEAKKVWAVNKLGWKLLKENKLWRKYRVPLSNESSPTRPRAKRDFCIPLQSHLNKKQFTLQIWLKHVRRVDGAGVHLVGQVVDGSPLTGLPLHLSFQMLPFLPIYRSRALNPLKKPASRKMRKLLGAYVP